MYTQSFGNFLLRKGAVTAEELVNAMAQHAAAHLKLGTIAIHEGLLTAPEVDKICKMQALQNKKFGEIAIEEGYLTQEQVDKLLSAQKPDYLLLGQILIEEGKLTNTDFENLFADYQSEYEIYDLDSDAEQKQLVTDLLHDFCESVDDVTASIAIDYMTLLFNNLVRFIGNDFMPLALLPCVDGYPTNYCIVQHIAGKMRIQAAMDMQPSTALVFASRFADEEFESFDEYAKAALEDFLNLQNGLFNVNMSNQYSVELTLQPPEVHTQDILEFTGATYTLPIVFPFGMFHFVLAF